MYVYLGWFFVVILGIMILPALLSFLFKKSTSARKNKFLKELLKLSRKSHKIIVLLVIVLAPVHGYLALGGLRFHTGSLVLISIIVTSILGYRHYKLKKKSSINLHKLSVALVAVFLGVHLLYPNLIWYLMN